MLSSVVWSTLNTAEKEAVLARPAMENNANLEMQVASILNNVSQDGDSALINMTQEFDGVLLSQLKVEAEKVDAAIKSLSSSRQKALETAYGQIKRFHAAQIQEDVTVETCPGVVCTLKTEAIEAVGLYIPAGTAPLPSTVLMLGVPAQLAGCKRKVLVSPPDKNGNIAPEVLAAARLCGITEIYAIGGAQAIAALAFGTKTISPVNKVFGPGNKYVTEAKKQLALQIPGFAIDMPAGPSEVLVIADKNANPAFVAADLLSQAEHGSDSQVILLSDSATLISDVQQQINKQLNELSRAEIAKKALTKSVLIQTDTIEDAISISNCYGPEHLIVQTNNARALIGKLRNAGSIFLGKYTPESAGDYASGTNHVLPTYGYSKVVSSLSLADFSRRYTVQEITRQGLSNLAECIIELTDAEGLDAHQRAVTIRLEQDEI